MKVQRSRCTPDRDKLRLGGVVTLDGATRTSKMQKESHQHPRIDESTVFFIPCENTMCSNVSKPSMIHL